MTDTTAGRLAAGHRRENTRPLGASRDTAVSSFSTRSNFGIQRAGLRPAADFRRSADTKESEEDVLRYIELKTGFADNGPAWIAHVKLSKSGRTVYFDGKALKRSNRGGASGNHYDLATGEQYWVSGVKKTGEDRHWAGSGVIRIEAGAVGQYLRVTDKAELDRGRFEVIPDLEEPDPSKFVALENRPLE